MNFNIEIRNKKTRYGYIKGKIENYNWFALVQKREVDYGINPVTLKRGNGKVVRLCIYEELTNESIINKRGNFGVKLIYADYRRKWNILNETHMNTVKELVNYLERRYSLQVIK